MLPPLGNSSTSVSTQGYWADNAAGATTTSGAAVFQQFQAGAYTVIAADEWGQVVLLHFRAVPVGGPIDNIHQVTFHQNGACSFTTAGLFYIAPWSVTLDNVTRVEPMNGTVPSDEYTSTANSVNFAAIVFSVPDGTYNYSVAPSGEQLLSPASGAVTVNGTDVTVQIEGATPPSCGPPFLQLISMTISSNPGRVTDGSAVNLAATISGLRGAPNGTISWTDGGSSGNFSSPVCTLTQSAYASWSCSVIYVPSPSITTSGAEVQITASYGGDQTYPPISATTVFT